MVSNPVLGCIKRLRKACVPNAPRFFQRVPEFRLARGGLGGPNGFRAREWQVVTYLNRHVSSSSANGVVSVLKGRSAKFSGLERDLIRGSRTSTGGGLLSWERERNRPMTRCGWVTESNPLALQSSRPFCMRPMPRRYVPVT